jgi:hypothetical protein
VRKKYQRPERKSNHKFEVVRGQELLVRVPLPMAEVWAEMQAQVEELTGQAGMQILRAILEEEVTRRVGPPRCTTRHILLRTEIGAGAKTTQWPTRASMGARIFGEFEHWSTPNPRSQPPGDATMMRARSLMTSAETVFAVTIRRNL